MKKFGATLVATAAAVAIVTGCSSASEGHPSFKIDKNEFNAKTHEYCVEGKYGGDEEVTIVLLKSVNGSDLKEVKGDGLVYAGSYEEGNAEGTNSHKRHNTFQTLEKDYVFMICDYQIRENSFYRLVIWDPKVGHDHPEKLRVITESDRITK